MNKVALALGSFIVGACCASLALSLSQTSTSAQVLVGVAGANTEPVVPPLSLHFSGGGVVGGSLQPLDGLDCDGCVISVDRLTYGGGAYRLNNAQLRNNMSIELKGAALNTLTLLRALGALPAPPKPPQMQSTPPMIKAALELKAQSDFTLVSLEGVKK
jgi:hypothetical protein